jgi:phenylalanyl-tRNA synthetase alpha subunit
MKLQQIAEFFQSQGKTSSHSSVLHAVNTFETNVQYNRKIGEWLTQLTKSNKGVNNKSKREFVKLKANHLNNENINKIVNIIDELEKKQLVDESS